MLTIVARKKVIAGVATFQEDEPKVGIGSDGVVEARWTTVVAHCSIY